MEGPTTHTFLTYEQAEQIKALGYDEPTYFFYSKEVVEDGTPIVVHKGFSMTTTNSLMEQIGSTQISAPTQAQAAKWLREKGCSVRVNYSQSYGDWFYDILNLNDGSYYDAEEYYDTYEEAMSEGINDILEQMKAEK